MAVSAAKSARVYSSKTPLNWQRLQMIATALVKINALKGIALTHEEAERFACRILLDERES